MLPNPDPRYCRCPRPLGTAGQTCARCGCEIPMGVELDVALVGFACAFDAHHDCETLLCACDCHVPLAKALAFALALSALAAAAIWVIA